MNSTETKIIFNKYEEMNSLLSRYFFLSQNHILFKLKSFGNGNFCVLGFALWNKSFGDWLSLDVPGGQIKNVKIFKNHKNWYATDHKNLFLHFVSKIELVFGIVFIFFLSKKGYEIVAWKIFFWTFKNCKLSPKSHFFDFIRKFEFLMIKEDLFHWPRWENLVFRWIWNAI